MLEKIEIANFKSIENLSLSLGRFNVFIGENGGGKSNILEAIAFLGGFLDDKLDNEYLLSRGIRNTSPNNFKSLFHKQNIKKPINFSVVNNEEVLGGVNLEFNSSKKKWKDINQPERTNKKYFSESIDKIVNGEMELKKNHEESSIKNIIEEMVALKKKIFSSNNYEGKEEEKKKYYFLSEIFNDLFVDIPDTVSKELVDFLIYSPENTTLRNFSDENQILPLGIRGEGLFKEIKRLSQKKSKKQITEIIEGLSVLDWFEKFDFPSTNFPGEKSINITDRFLEETINFFDQRLANEGFLYLLFYFTLLISEKTPKLFAIDNIDSSLNPKLCSELIKRMVKLSKTNKKQVIVTTHSPFTLDGLDLDDDDQRLFVVRRSFEGYTMINRVKPKDKLDIKLSEAWMRGYIGGLPNNF